MESNLTLRKLVLRNNSVGKQYEDSAGLAKMFATSTALTTLDSQNCLGRSSGRPLGCVSSRAVSVPPSRSPISTSRPTNFGPTACAPSATRYASAPRCCASTCRTTTQGGRRRSPTCCACTRRCSVSIIEAAPQTRIERSFHLDARGKEQIGRALLESPATLRYHLRYLRSTKAPPPALQSTSRTTPCSRARSRPTTRSPPST